MGEHRSAAEPRRQPRQGGWSRLTSSRFVPAVVISLIVAALAGLFVGAYCLAMAAPVPHRIPVAVTGRSAKGERFVDALEAAPRTSLVLHPYADYDRALAAVDAQREFAILQRRPAGVEVDVASAAGASVARVLSRSAPAVGQALGIPVQVKDVKPLPATDPQGLALFYIAWGRPSWGSSAPSSSECTPWRCAPPNGSPPPPAVRAGRPVHLRHDRLGARRGAAAVRPVVGHLRAHDVHRRHDLHRVPHLPGPLGAAADVGAAGRPRQPLLRGARSPGRCSPRSWAFSGGSCHRARR